MTTAQVLSIGIAQTWQVAALASIVWLAVRYATREHSHVSHMLWTLVLIKCLTPPIWSSPVGLFSRWSSTTVLHQLSNASRLSTENIPSKLATLAVADDSNKTPREISILTQVSMSTRAGVSKDLRPAMGHGHWLAWWCCCIRVSSVDSIRCFSKADPVGYDCHTA